MTPRITRTGPRPAAPAAGSGEAVPADASRPGPSRRQAPQPPWAPRPPASGGASGAPRARAPLPAPPPGVASLIADMSALSDVRRPRLFFKSASEQYQYAKRLSPEQRTALEQALAAEVRQRPDSDAGRAALAMWMSVQQARLRTHDAAHRQVHGAQQASALATGIAVVTLPLVPVAFMLQRRSYYDTPLRPEYATAFDNFMRMLRDPALPPELRASVAERLDYHRRSEGTIAPRQSELLRIHGAEGLAASGYLVATDPHRPPVSSTERAVIAQREATAAAAAAAARDRPAAAAQAQPPEPARTRWPEVLTQAIGTLTGTHPADLDLSGTMDGRQRQAVIDHLHDLGNSDLEPHGEAIRAVRAARGDVPQTVAHLLSIVQRGVLSTQTQRRAALAQQDAERAAARRRAASAADHGHTGQPPAPRT